MTAATLWCGAQGGLRPLDITGHAGTDGEAGKFRVVEFYDIENTAKYSR